MKTWRCTVLGAIARANRRGDEWGQTNYYGSKSRRGTEVAALYYRLIETAKLLGVEPKTYLRTALRKAIEQPGTAVLPGELLD